MSKPVLFVTNHAPPFRVGAFKALHERENVVFALIGGDVRHGGGGTTDDAFPFPVIRPPQRTVARIAASGRYRAVIAGISGKIALPAAYAGARAGRVPFVLWATIWAHPRTPAHALSYLPLRHIYRHADAIATYGPHVSAYVRTKHPSGPVFEAPQAVDSAFWGAAGHSGPPRATSSSCSPADRRRRRDSRSFSRPPTWANWSSRRTARPSNSATSTRVATS